MRAAGHLDDGLVGELDEFFVEPNRLDGPDLRPGHVERLLSGDALGRLPRVLEHPGELRRVEVPLVEKLLRRLDDRCHDAWFADDAAGRADGAVAGALR